MITKKQLNEVANSQSEICSGDFIKGFEYAVELFLNGKSQADRTNESTNSEDDGNS
jgi:hypothetical protein